MKAVSEAGLEVRQPPEDWLVKVYDGGRLIDLLFEVVGRPVDENLLARASLLRVEAVTMPVLSATDTTPRRSRGGCGTPSRSWTPR